jgi:hypothetical protein
MRRMTATLVTLAVVAGTLISFAPAASADTASAQSAFVADLNNLRASRGLPPLPVDPALTVIAESWSAQMAAAGTISYNPYLTSEAPAGWLSLGENVGMGPDEPAINAAFVDTPEHYVNMVSPVFNGVGVGVVMSGSTMFVTVDFEQLPTPPAATTSSPVAPVSSGSQSCWLAAADGGVFAFGGAGFYGSTGGMHLNQQIVGMAATPDHGGYWLVARDGGIFAFGDARFFGSTGSMTLNQPIVGMAATPDGGGYWLVARDGGLFSFGDAGFFGSTGSMALNRPIVGMASTPGGDGYWLVGSDGGLFSFGDASFVGSTGGTNLAQPIVGMTPTPSGQGYTLASANGSVFNFGDAGGYGSAAGQTGGAAVVGISSSPATGGYDLATQNGIAFGFGAGGTAVSSAGPLNQPIVAIAALAV